MLRKTIPIFITFLILNCSSYNKFQTNKIFKDIETDTLRFIDKLSRFTRQSDTTKIDKHHKLVIQDINYKSINLNIEKVIYSDSIITSRIMIYKSKIRDSSILNMFSRNGFSSDSFNNDTTYLQLIYNSSAQYSGFPNSKDQLLPLKFRRYTSIFGIRDLDMGKNLINYEQDAPLPLDFFEFEGAPDLLLEFNFGNENDILNFLKSLNPIARAAGAKYCIKSNFKNILKQCIQTSLDSTKFNYHFHSDPPSCFDLGRVSIMEYVEK